MTEEHDFVSYAKCMVGRQVGFTPVCNCNWRGRIHTARAMAWAEWYRHRKEELEDDEEVRKAEQLLTGQF